MKNTNTQDTSWLKLSGQVCVVTRAGRGIGAEVARQLAAAGATVAVLDRDPGAAAALASELEEGGACVGGFGVDVAQPECLFEVACELRRTLGPCQVLVNNAATRCRSSLLDMSLTQWKEVTDTNLTGAFLCSQVFGRQMVEEGKGGSLIHLGSVTGQIPAPQAGAYSVSKAGMSMLSRVLALELGGHRIRSNVVSPGLVRTPATEMAYADENVLATRLSMVPVGRISTPAEIAQVVLFLASDRSSYVNAQDIAVDGGFSQGLMGLVPQARGHRD